MITAVMVESIKNAENVVEIAALEIGDPVGEEDPGVDVPTNVNVGPGEPEVGDPEDPAPTPDPPAAIDNWANPTDGGDERNTEYTFFRNVSPTIQLGVELFGTFLVPRPRSKKAPTHKGLFSLS